MYNFKKLEEFFGPRYELQLLHEIIGDRQIRGQDKNTIHRNFFFGESIIDVLSPTIFQSEDIAELVTIIKDFYGEYEAIPYYDAILRKYQQKYISDKKTLKEKKAFLKSVLKSKDVDFLDVRKSAIKYVQTLNLYLASKKIQKIAESGDITRFDESVDIIENVLKISDVEEDDIEVEEGDYTDLRDGKRTPIPTKLRGLDYVFNGGISKGELVLAIAGLKVGKTTLSTVLANNAFMEGYNVLQVFFEDTPEQIRIKQRGLWSKIGLSDISKSENERYIKESSDKKIKRAKEAGGRWILKKFSSVDTKVKDIERYIKKKIIQGFVPDIVLIDYTDCIKAKGTYQKQWEGEPEVLREIEEMCSKKNLNFACWAFTQGNRGSINAEEVDVNEMGGNLKKAQIGHVIISISKTKEQRQENLANVKIIGSRIGEDGHLFRNCEFNNGKMKIEINPEHLNIMSERDTEDFK